MSDKNVRKRSYPPGTDSAENHREVHQQPGTSSSSSFSFSLDQMAATEPVGLVCRNGDVNLLYHMIQHGRPMTYPDDRRWFPIHEAAAALSYDCAELLIRTGMLDLSEIMRVTRSTVTLRAAFSKSGSQRGRTRRADTASSGMPRLKQDPRQESRQAPS